MCGGRFTGDDTMLRLFVWRVGLHDFAMPFSGVSQVVRAVAVTAVPDAPPFGCGVINVQGKIVHVIDVRKRFRLPERALAPADHFIIVCTPRRTLALWVDAAQGVVDYEDEAVNPLRALSPEADSQVGVIKLLSGLVLVQDLEQCLAAGDTPTLGNPMVGAG